MTLFSLRTLVYWEGFLVEGKFMCACSMENEKPLEGLIKKNVDSLNQSPGWILEL